MVSDLPESLVFQSVDEVTSAIADCKRAILETEENTESRREMVLRLIRLQILLEDRRDREETSTSSTSGAGAAARMPDEAWAELANSSGHRFVAYDKAKDPIPLVSDAKRVQCEVCTAAIWFHLQSSHHCLDCGYSLHTVCRGAAGTTVTAAAADDGSGSGTGTVVMRGCVAQKIRSKPDFILDICPEKSLPDQRFRCAECDRKFSTSDAAAQPRLCDYTGLSFCPSCHWMAEMAVPARIVHNWDFDPQPVSQATKQYLLLMARKPVINLMRENPKLGAVVQELAFVNDVRRKIMQFKKYLTVCRLASEQKLLLHLVARQHFVDGPEFYSLQDLLEIKSGSLPKFLEKVLKEFSDHVHNCVLCLAKGFICEICVRGASRNAMDEPGLDGVDDVHGGGGDDRGKDGGHPSEKDGPAAAAAAVSLTTTLGKDVCKEDVIFPFDSDAKQCDKCQAVYHRFCLKSMQDCPKCDRLKTRKSAEAQA